MFKAVLRDISLIRDSLDTVSSLINEGTFKVSSNGLSLIAMDPTNSAMVIYDLLASAFDEYECTGDVKMTVSIPYFVSILKRASAGDSVEFKLLDGSNVLTIRMIGDSTRTFTIPLLETYAQETKPPEKLTEGFKTEVEVEASTIREGVKDAMMISDCVSFSCDGNSFTMQALGDTNEASLQLNNESPSLIKIDAKEAVKSKYSVEYLEKMTKLSKVSKTVVIKFANDYPLQLDYLVTDKLKVSFILAPRISVD